LFPHLLVIPTSAECDEIFLDHKLEQRRLEEFLEFNVYLYTSKIVFVANFVLKNTMTWVVSNCRKTFDRISANVFA
jgi:hypothetical protein